MTRPSSDDADPADLSDDTLLGGRVRLRQPRRGYRVAIDPVLLASAVPARDGDRVLEIGTGTGAAALCLVARVPGCHVTGLEIQPGLARIAAGNAALNDLADRLVIVEGDLRTPPAGLSPGAFDHVMANPPYLERGKASPATLADRAIAHMEGEAGLTDWVGACAGMVRRHGTVSLIHRADRLDEILHACRQHGLGGIVVHPLWSKRDGRDARRVIVVAGKGAKSPFRLAAGLVLHRNDGAFTPEADAILREGGGLVL